MANKIPFVDRKKELDLIEKHIVKSKGKHILWIQGPGGSGKTRLLEEVLLRYGYLKKNGYEFSPIVDFDDRSLHIPENLDRMLVQWLGEKPLKQYLRETLDRQKMEEAGVSEETLLRQSDHVTQWLIETFNQSSKKKRRILLFDTVEKVEDKVWQHICDLLQHAENTFILLVSRKNDRLLDTLNSKITKTIEIIQWEPLEDEKFGELYLDQKQRSLHVALPPSICKKLVLLVGGRPILIDLTVEAISRNLMPEILTHKTYAEIKALSSRKSGKLRQDFETQLVRQIMDVRDSMDRLVLVMSRVYPLSQKMVTEFLNITERDAKNLFEEAKLKTTIKILPDGRISLHDEIRTMVENYVWPYIDPDGDRQKRDSRIAIDYLRHEEVEIQKDLKKLEDQASVEKTQDAGISLDVMSKMEALKQYLWDVREQLLAHSLYINTEEGIQTFADIFDRATRAYHFPYREVLLRKVEPYMPYLPVALKYEVNSRKVKASLDTGNYIEADRLTTQVLKDKSIAPQQRVDMLIQHGNIKIRLGKLSEGKEKFEKAVRICKAGNDIRNLVPALNARGWGYRQVGNIDKAITDYQNALELSFSTGDELRRAWILNNLAYVYSQQGRFNPALALCEQAKELWKKIGFGRGMGALYEVYGHIYIKMGRYDEAMEYFQLALDEFKSRDVEWQSRIHAGLGFVYRMMKDRKNAERELKLALDYRIQKDRAMILHRMAHLQLEGGKIKKAKNLFEQSYEASREISDAYHELNNLGDLAKLAVGEKDFSNAARFEKLYQEYKTTWPDMTYSRVEGMILRHLGDLMLGNPKNNLSKAITYYQKAFLLLARYETYKEYSVQKQLEILDAYFHELKVPANVKSKIGQSLYFVWQKNNLIEHHPEALGFFAQWGGTVK